MFRDCDVPICASRVEDAAKTARTYPRQACAPFNVTGHPAPATLAGLSDGAGSRRASPTE